MTENTSKHITVAEAEDFTWAIGELFLGDEVVTGLKYIGNSMYELYLADGTRKDRSVGRHGSVKLRYVEFGGADDPVASDGAPAGTWSDVTENTNKKVSVHEAFKSRLWEGGELWLETEIGAIDVIEVRYDALNDTYVLLFENGNQEDYVLSYADLQFRTSPVASDGAPAVNLTKPQQRDLQRLAEYGSPLSLGNGSVSVNSRVVATLVEHGFARYARWMSCAEITDAGRAWLAAQTPAFVTFTQTEVDEINHLLDDQPRNEHVEAAKKLFNESLRPADDASAQADATPAPIADVFKIGDTVRLLPHTLPPNGFVSDLRDKGVVCRVRSVGDDGIVGVTVPGAGWFYFAADELELAPDDDTPAVEATITLPLDAFDGLEAERDALTAKVAALETGLTDFIDATTIYNVWNLDTSECLICKRRSSDDERHKSHCAVGKAEILLGLWIPTPPDDDPTPPTPADSADAGDADTPIGGKPTIDSANWNERTPSARDAFAVSSPFAAAATEPATPLEALKAASPLRDEPTVITSEGMPAPLIDTPNMDAMNERAWKASQQAMGVYTKTTMTGPRPETAVPQAEKLTADAESALLTVFRENEPDLHSDHKMAWPELLRLRLIYFMGNYPALTVRGRAEATALDDAQANNAKQGAA